MTHEGGAETSPGRRPTEGKSIRPFRAKRIAFLLVGIVAMAAVVASMAPLSGQSRDDLASKLARREVQRSRSSIPGREIVQVETLDQPVQS